MDKIVKKNILGIEVSNATENKVLEYIFDSLKKKADPYYIVTPNPEMVMRSQRDKDFKAVLNTAEIAVCDGVGLYLASRVLGKSLKQRIAGVDLLEKICKESVRSAVNIGFLGGKEGVAERAAECLMKKYPGMLVSFISDNWSESGFSRARTIHDSRFRIHEEKKIMNHESDLMNQKSIDILFVAFGFPKQELWMAENRKRGIYKVALGVGGAFDYLSGAVPRAPKIIQIIGLEWLYRLIIQPWRWRRQLALLSFITLVLKEKLARSEIDE